MKQTCCRCGAEHNRIGQGYCYACHAQANRDYRERQRKLRARMARAVTDFGRSAASLSAAGEKLSGALARHQDLLARLDRGERE